MRDRLRLSIGAIQKYLKLFHTLDLSEGEIVKVLDIVVESQDIPYTFAMLKGSENSNDKRTKNTHAEARSISAMQTPFIYMSVVWVHS